MPIKPKNRAVSADSPWAEPRVPAVDPVGVEPAEVGVGVVVTFVQVTSDGGLVKLAERVKSAHWRRGNY